MNPFIFTLCLIGLILGFVYAMARVGISRRDNSYSEEETELIQALNRNLVKMEQRVDALETLLADQQESKRPPTYREVMRDEMDTKR